MGDVGDAQERAGLHRFFVAPGASSGAGIAFGPQQQQQLRKVLRMRTGDTVIVCPGDGSEVLTRLHMDPTGVWGEPLERWAGKPEPHRDVWLYQSALRGDRFTWLLQKATEIGVRGIVPVLFRYTQQADYQSRLDRYQAVVREAAEQSRRSRLPEVLAALPFQQALEQAATLKDSQRLILDEQETAASLRTAISSPSLHPICLFIGPEGGLSTEERAYAVSATASLVTLGTRILRSETAGLIAAALALAESGDLG